MCSLVGAYQIDCEPIAMTPVPAPMPAPSKTIEICFYANINYLGAKACTRWDGITTERHAFFGRVKSVSAKTVADGADINNDTTIKVLLNPTTRRSSQVALTRSSPNITVQLPVNALINSVIIAKP